MLKGLRWIRERRGLTLQQIEDLTGISFNTISRYERGVISPNIDTALKIAQALGVTVDELLNGSANQELDVKIIMGVKSLAGLAGIELASNNFVFGVNDNEPSIVLMGNVRIDTPEDRVKAREAILKKFDAACWMYDHKGNAEA
ncbi:MAG: helix-turn-helix transcriptional regulator [Synergistaceae bacterium]|nr:helix-turn-helix transcriptional regulator [Synergistaceae bacterium]